MQVSKLAIYPVKSLNGIDQSNSKVVATGLEHDRMMMLVDENNRFITQRKYPQMALIKLSGDYGNLRVVAPDMPEIELSRNFSADSQQLDVWGEACHGFVADDVINHWFSEFLQKQVRLMRYDLDTPRPLDPDFSKAGDIVGFADDSPLLAISEESLADLNGRLSHPVNFRNFRPNIVFKGTTAFQEDGWKELQIGEVKFDVAKRCSRCILTTVDPDTGEKREDGEPINTLGEYRRSRQGIMFGINLIPRSKGTIKVSDTILVT